MFDQMVELIQATGELMQIGAELTEIKQKLIRMGIRSLPKAGARKQKGTIKWAHPLIVRAQELADRAMPLQKRVVELMNEAGLNSGDALESIEKTQKAVGAINSYRGGEA